MSQGVALALVTHKSVHVRWWRPVSAAPLWLWTQGFGSSPSQKEQESRLLNYFQPVSDISVLGCVPNIHLDNSIVLSVFCKICTVIHKCTLTCIIPDNVCVNSDMIYLLWFSVTLLISPPQIQSIKPHIFQVSLLSQVLPYYLFWPFFFLCTALPLALHVSYSKQLRLIKFYSSWFPAHPNWQHSCRFDPFFHKNLGLNPTTAHLPLV